MRQGPPADARGATRFAVGAGGAAGLLAALSPQFAAAQQVPPNDARVIAHTPVIGGGVR